MHMDYRQHQTEDFFREVRLLTIFIIGLLLLALPVFASDLAPPTTVQTYQQEQLALAQEENALVAQGATQDQLDAWRQKNAARFAAQRQRASAMASASAAQPIPPITPNIPANASSTLQDYLTTQAALANAQAQIHNQLAQALPRSANDAQILQMHQQEMQLFQQQHAGELQLQAQRSQVLAQEAGQIPMPMPPPLQMPPDASPRMQAYLTLRDQLMREQTQLFNQHLTDSPQTKAAIIQWSDLRKSTQLKS